MARTPATRNYQTGDLLRQFTSEIDRLFDQGWPASAPGVPSVGEWAPAVDVREEPEEYVIHADVPGIDPKDLEITLENGVLSIRGQRQEETTNNSNGVRHVERSYGSFVRRFSLPDAASDEDVDARAEQGVLTLRIRKKDESRPRRIEVKS